MRILMINNAGAGWADFIEVPAGTTVATLFATQMGNAAASDYLIRVNRLPVAPDQVLQENDRVSITATKIEGAVI
jgi:hypothetical protein